MRAKTNSVICPKPPAPSDTETIVQKIVELIDKDPEEMRMDRWMYARKNLSPTGMQKTWTRELLDLFDNG